MSREIQVNSVMVSCSISLWQVWLR